VLDVRAPARPSVARVLSLWGGLIVLAVVWGHVLVSRGHALDLAAPPFWSGYRFHPSARVLPALIVAISVVRFGPDLARDLRWRPLLVATAAGSAVWAVAMAFVDNLDGVNAITDPVRLSRNDYLQTAQGIGSLHAFLSHFVA
jgi:hypothetical protein